MSLSGSCTSRIKRGCLASTNFSTLRNLGLIGVPQTVITNLCLITNHVTIGISGVGVVGHQIIEARLITGTISHIGPVTDYTCYEWVLSGI